ncbi:hypothetical protein EON80_17435 [bacterium]|nr:MAG: hypothetical protein EON80_17435 [bacterium]
MKLISVRSTPLILIAFALTGPLCSLALAQPDTNPPDVAVFTNIVTKNRKVDKRTPEQIQQMDAQNGELAMLKLRRQLTWVGITDTATQNLIVDYRKAQFHPADLLRDGFEAVLVALQDKAIPDKAIPDEEFAVLLGEFQSRVGEEKARRAKSFRAIAEKIDLARNPRLDATLLVLGFVGDESLMVEGINGTVNALKSALVLADAGIADVLPREGGPALLAALAEVASRADLRDVMARRADESELLRKRLTLHGVNEKSLQDTILAYASGNRQAKEDLDAKYKGILVGLGRDLFSDAQLAGQLNEFRALIQEENDFREVAFNTLSQNLDFGKNPRLDALLMSLGITGNELALVSVNEPKLKTRQLKQDLAEISQNKETKVVKKD